MTTAEWIIMVILAATLFIFLLMGIILLAKCIGIANDVKRVVATGQKIAERSVGIVEGVRAGFTSAITGMIASFVNNYNNKKEKGGNTKDGKE